MLKRKKIREKGKTGLRRIFQEFKQGDKVVLLRNLSRKGLFPKRFQGRTAEIEGKMGRAYIVGFLNGKKHKKLVVRPDHLKKLVENKKRKNKE